MTGGYSSVDRFHERRIKALEDRINKIDPRQRAARKFAWNELAQAIGNRSDEQLDWMDQQDGITERRGFRR